MPQLRAERFADSAQKAHSAPSRWLLAVIIQDHASTLEGGETSCLKRLRDSLLQRMASSLGAGNATVPTQSSNVCWTVAGAGFFDDQQEVEPRPSVVHRCKENHDGGFALHARLRAIRSRPGGPNRQPSVSVFPHSEEVIP
jgi:hypothetical protein